MYGQIPPPVIRSVELLVITQLEPHRVDVQWHPTPVFLPGKSHGWRILEGCSPWGCWGSDTTERFHFHFSISCVGEGNGNPLQCSCLENPRHGGDWWAAIYGVTQSRTWLKRLSNSSSKLLMWEFNWKLYLGITNTLKKIDVNLDKISGILVWNQYCK